MRLNLPVLKKGADLKANEEHAQQSLSRPGCSTSCLTASQELGFELAL